MKTLIIFILSTLLLSCASNKKEEVKKIQKKTYRSYFDKNCSKKSKRTCHYQTNKKIIACVAPDELLVKKDLRGTCSTKTCKRNGFVLYDCKYTGDKEFIKNIESFLFKDLMSSVKGKRCDRENVILDHHCKMTATSITLIKGVRDSKQTITACIGTKNQSAPESLRGKCTEKICKGDNYEDCKFEGDKEVISWVIEQQLKEINSWIGSYTNLDGDTLTIEKKNKTELFISAMATSEMGNIAEINGKLRVKRNKAFYDGDCHIEITKKKKELIVSDNHDCGGVGVSFSGKYKTN